MGAEIEPDTVAGDDACDANDQGAQGGSGADKDRQEAEGKGTNAEAARYRVKLREAEGERDRLVGVVESLQRSAVDRLAEAAGIKPSALWASGVEIADLLVGGDGDDASVIDTDKVTQAIDHAVAELGLQTQPRKPVTNPHQGQFQDDPEPSGDDKFAEALSLPGER